MNETQTRNGTRTAASGSTGASSTKSSAARTSKRKAEAEERTRDRVLREVLNNGPVSAATLGELLSLTPAAVRRHLDALESNNMIEVAPIKKHGAGAGRPARRYVIAPQGHERLGNDYLIMPATPCKCSATRSARKPSKLSPPPEPQKWKPATDPS